MVRSWDVAGDLLPVDLRSLISADRAELLGFLRSLDESGWAAPTANTGWNVHDVALQVLGSQIGRLGSTRGGAAREGRMPFDDLTAGCELPIRGLETALCPLWSEGAVSCLAATVRQELEPCPRANRSGQQPDGRLEQRADRARR